MPSRLHNGNQLWANDCSHAVERLGWLLTPALMPDSYRDL
jgi:hypothetical protein